MRIRFEFPKDKFFEIDEAQIGGGALEVRMTLQGEVNIGGWIPYKNSMGEISFINTNRCIRITEKKS